MANSDDVKKATESDVNNGTVPATDAVADPPIEFHDNFKENDPLLNSKESPLYNVDPNAFQGIQTSYERVRLFDNPFVAIVMNTKIDKYCSYCLRLPEYNKELLHCGACNFARYCNKDCQRLAWKVHRNECRRLGGVFPNLPLTEVLFLSRIIDKVIFLEEYGDKFGWERIRRFDELLGHKEEIKNTADKMEHFEKLCQKMALFRKDEMIDKGKFFDIFCKTAINSHSIHTNAGDEIGIALDLGVSQYDHSCRPNGTMVFDGFKVYLRPLSQEISPYDINKTFISYIDVGRSKYQRRKELKIKWYFDCHCERCLDPEDDILTSIKCTNKDCDEPLITAEDAEPKSIECPKCKAVASKEYVEEAQKLMLTLPVRFNADEKTDEVKAKLEKAEKILHPRNIYVCRLQTALFHFSGTLVDKMPEMQKTVFENYKRCFPAMDRHNGFQLINIARALVESDQRKEAVPYVFDAMNIFEVCFGMEHPYYLQTIALWTYLDKNIEKTNEELYQLMTFDNTRPVDISSLLGTPTSLPELPPPAIQA